MPKPYRPKFRHGIVMNDFKCGKADDIDAIVNDFGFRCGIRKVRSENDYACSPPGEVFVEFVGMRFQSADMWRIIGGEKKN